MKKSVEELPGVLPGRTAETPLYLVLSSVACLTVAEWEHLGRPAWSVRWLCPVELPGKEVRPEYLYARTAIGCHLPPTVAGCPPFEAIAAELGYSAPRGELWVPATVVQCTGLDAARMLADRAQIGSRRYVTWDRSLTAVSHQLYFTDGGQTLLREQPVYPEQSLDQAARVDGQADETITRTPGQKPPAATDTAFLPPGHPEPKRRPNGRRKAG